MRRYGDGRKPVWVTELSWPASSGKTTATGGFETNEKGQAKRLRKGLVLLARARRKLRIERVFWYTWLSAEQGPSVVRLVRPAAACATASSSARRR